jgi:hypothetical protein
MIEGRCGIISVLYFIFNTKRGDGGGIISSTEAERFV